MRQLFLFLFILTTFSGQLNAQWLNANPGAGGQLQHVVCDPNITGRMYLCSDMEGYYISDDFGDHWNYKGWESPFSFVFNIAVEPGNSSRLYLTSSQGLAITDDAGDSWKVINSFSNMSIATIAVDPNNKNTICFAESWLETVIGRKNGAGKIYFSKDRGESWQGSTFKSYTTDKNVFSINFHPSPQNNDVLVANSDGIFASNDELNSWKKIPSPVNTKYCRGCDFTPDGKWLYAVYVRNDNKTGVFIKNYENGEWQELDSNGILQSVNQSHWRPRVWPGTDENKHYVLFGTLGTGGNYNDNSLNEGRFLVNDEKVYGHVNRILKISGVAEPFDVGWNAYWSHCRTYDYYPKNWEVEGISRGVFTMSQQSTFRGDAAKSGEWIVNTCHHYDTKDLHKFYRTNGTASTWVWDIAGIEKYVVMGMGDNGVAESWDNGFSWTQKFAPNLWNVDALEIVKGEKTIVLAGRTNGFGGALNQNKGWFYYREVDVNKPTDGWKSVIDGNIYSDLKGLDPVLNRIATIQSDPHKPERVYVGTNAGLYVTENIFELINNNPQYYFKSISQPKIGSTLTRRVHVDPNDENTLYLRCWKGTYRIEKNDAEYTFIQLKVAGSTQYLNDGWGHNGDITVWAKDSITTCLAVTRNINPHRELWLSYDKGETFLQILNKDEAFQLRPPENNWYTGQSPIRFGGLCGIDSLLFSSVHLRGGGDGLTKGISFLKGTIQADSSIVWEDFTGDPRNGGIWFPAARSGKIWKDGSGNSAIHLATMGAGMWKRSWAETFKATASFTSDVTIGNLPLTVNFDASTSLPSSEGNSIVSYNWDFGDGITGKGEQVTHKYSQTKVHTAKLTIIDDKGNKAYAYKNIEGYVYSPVADFVASTYHGKTGHEIQFFAELSFDENPNDSIIQYKWDFKDGNVAYGKNVSHTYTRDGRFFVKLTVTNRAYKSSSVTKSVTIELNTNVGEIDKGEAPVIYPNPFKDRLNIQLRGKSDITVLNALGQKIYFQEDVDDRSTLNTGKWGKGVYLVLIQRDEKPVKKKVVKQ